jgi:RNA polymerase sigma-70 factor (ECF subfamily)
MAVVISLDDRRTEPADAQLVQAARNGDREAMETLYRRHVRMAAGLAYRILGRPHEVDDVVQDAFVAALRGLSSLHDGQAFAKWLGSIVVRVARRRIQRARLRRRLRITPTDPLDVDRLVSESAPPDVAAELRAVYELVDGLPPDERIALVLRRVEGLTVPEIAERMGRSTATVKRRLGSAEERLTGRLGERGRSS